MKISLKYTDESTRQAKDIQIAQNALSTVPDIREDIVRNISERIANGTYTVSAHDVAKKICSQ